LPTASTKTPNNKEDNPLRIYTAAFAAADVEEIVSRTGVSFSDGAFSPVFFGKTLCAAHPDFSLTAEGLAENSARLSYAAKILMLRMLLNSKRTLWNGAFLAYREIPGAAIYDSNFSGRVRSRLARAYGKNADTLADFGRRAAVCGAIPVRGFSKKDAAAYDFEVLPGAFIRVTVYLGDEEFPSTSQVLFSDNIVPVWDGEDLAALGEVLCRLLSEAVI
jgi:hypothetical protein